jgi:hypothetical protein
MEQNDQDILQTVPLAHLQMVARARRLSQVLALLNDVATGTAPANSEPLNAATSGIPSHLAHSLAPLLFASQELQELLAQLSEAEASVLREVVDCGGRVNSRDLAFYFQRKLGWGTEENEQDQDRDHGSDGESARPVEIHAGDTAQIVAQVQELLLATRYPVPRPHGVFELAVYQLLKWGLLFWGKQTHFGGHSYLSGAHDGVLVAPPSVVLAVRHVWPSAVAAQAMTPMELTAPAAQIQVFQRLLYLYWSYVATVRDGLSLVNNGLLARTSLRALCEHLAIEYQSEQMRLESDVPRLLFVRLLLQQLGLLQVRQGMLVARPAQDFFTLPLFERVRLCYTAYCETPFWNEMIRLPDINIRPLPDPLTAAHAEILHGRQQILARVLSELAEGSISFDLIVFIARTKLHVPSLLFPRHYGPRAERYSRECNPYGYDFRLRRGWLMHREGWYVVEGGFVRAMLTEPLQWLGLVQLEHQSGRLYFSLVPEAVALFRKLSVTYAYPEEGRLLVQPNFEVVALAPVSEGTLAMLDTFAERIRLEHVAQYRLTKASVARALRLGLGSDVLLRYLEQRVGEENKGVAEGNGKSDVPQNVRYSLVEWERQARRMELWPALTVIEVADAALLDQLLSADATRELIGRRLTPTLAEVPVQHLAALQEQLWQQELLPALTPVPAHELTLKGDDGAFPLHEPQWHLHTSGLLEPVYAVLDLYLVAIVAQFSNIDEASGWPRITEASLQQALQRGLTLEAILRFLRHYCINDIPGSLLIRYKLWGNGYHSAVPSIQVEQSPLLRLSGEVLHDLQADEELAPLLGDEITGSQHLVRVACENLAQVVAILQARGLSVDEEEVMYRAIDTHEDE